MKALTAMEREEMVEELAFWRAETMSDDVRSLTIRNALGLTPIDTRLLLLLHAAGGRPLTIYFIDDMLPGERAIGAIKVRICLLRRRIGFNAIKNWYGGYGLTPKGIALVDGILA